MNLSQILIKPVLTEKSVHQEVKNKYTFMVHEDATKVDIKNAFRSLYGVNVDKVNVLYTLPKTRMGKGRKPMEKKHVTRRAIITLKAGQKLDLTKGSASSTAKSKTPKKAATATA
jgi:large subunit ribosomal protein L23